MVWSQQHPPRPLSLVSVSTPMRKPGSCDLLGSLRIPAFPLKGKVHIVRWVTASSWHGLPQSSGEWRNSQDHVVNPRTSILVVLYRSHTPAKIPRRLPPEGSSSPSVALRRAPLKSQIVAFGKPSFLGIRRPAFV